MRSTIGRRRSKTVWCTTSCSRIVKSKIVKSLDERQRHPDERVVETDEAPGREREDRKLSRCHGEVPPRALLVELAHLFARKRRAKLSSERNRVLREVMGFHRDD